MSAPPAMPSAVTGPIDPRLLAEWSAVRKVVRDEVTASPLARLAAWLDRDEPSPRAGDIAPPGAHMLYFLSVTRQSLLGDEGGLPREGPPIPWRRKMWLGSRMQLHEPLRVGDAIERVETIKSIVPKSARSGHLLFVTFRDEISGPRGLSVVEEFDLVYRDDTPGPDPVPPEQTRPHDAVWRETVRVDNASLFRFSALTYNSHRIHYDHPYTTQVEKYPGLLIPGPLHQMLQLDLTRRQAGPRTLKEFASRAVRPAFCPGDLSVEGCPASDTEAALWSLDAQGCVVLASTLRWA
ncbi:MAG: MaoC family dehydratase N-terminal domain-containing protein [Devosia sp.]|nr:MaoC family dehydratase N-terminal domain-containing protein [Devosia sp.]